MEASKGMSFWLSIANIAISIATATGGYLMVTRVQQGVDEANLNIEKTKSTIDVFKFLGDLLPKAEIQCSGTQLDAVTVHVSCTQKNLGTQRLLIEAPTVDVVRSWDQATIGAQFYKISQQKENVVQPGTTGESNYTITALNISNVDWSKFDIETHLTARVDPVVMNLEKNELRDRVDGAILDAVSMQQYTSPTSTHPLQNSTPATATTNSSTSSTTGATGASQ